MGATAKVIVLKGDPKKPESAEHIIEFPDGKIETIRIDTLDGVKTIDHKDINHFAVLISTK